MAKIKNEHRTVYVTDDLYSKSLKVAKRYERDFAKHVRYLLQREVDKHPELFNKQN